MFRSELLEFDSCASLGELGLDSLSVFLGCAFLDGLGCALNEILSVLKAESSEFTDNLDDSELVCASTGENDVKFGLLLSGCRCGSCCACDCDGSGGNAEFLFECL